MNMAVGCEQMRRKPREDKGEKRLPNYIENLQAAARKWDSARRHGEYSELCMAAEELGRQIEIMNQIENG